MKRFLIISSQKAAMSFLRYQHYHPHSHRGLPFRFLQTQTRDSTETKAISFRFSRYSASAILNNTDHSRVDLQITSREFIKPSSPTPHHLRIFNLSSFDQFMVEVYHPLIIFLTNDDQASITHVINKRLKHLKETLSEILTRFYPYAGEIKDPLHVECNDKGIHFVEARVINQTLQEFLRQPDDQKVTQLVPTEPSSTNHIASIQANIFNCGGIALSSSILHKVIDAYSYFLFMNAWAAAVRGSPEKISPSFVGYELFPHSPSLKYSMHAKFTTRKEFVTKRFVFNSTALASLKSAANPPMSSSPSHGPTRTEATGALIWKAASKAASTIESFGPQSPHFLFSAVNLRSRSAPPLPKEAIGNLVSLAAGVCFPVNQPDLPSLMSEMRGSIAKINSDFIEARKGVKGHQTWAETVKAMDSLFDNVNEENFIALTSLLNSKVREIDFGWGKPIWFYHVNPGFNRLVTLNDTVKVGGVEAVVSLSPKEMEIFECDPEILSYATVDPSPLSVS